MPLRTTAIEMATERGWSMSELARRTGLSLRVLYYLRDGRQPSTATIASLMRTFPESTFDDLFVSSDSTMVQEDDANVESVAA